MNRKIKRADRATDEILALGAEARDHLQTVFTGHVLNGLGVFADVPALSRGVYLARAALARAAVLVAATDWPNDRDYDDETNCPLFASGGETSLQTAALLDPDRRQSGAGETACHPPLKKRCDEHSDGAGKAEADEKTSKTTFSRFLLCFGGGLLAAIACAAICWVVVDAIVPAAANVGLGFFMKNWWESPSSYEFIRTIEVCALANVFLFRAETILGASILLIGFRVGYQIRQWIAVGARPVVSIVMVNFVMLVLLCITVALLLLDFLPTNVPRSGACEVPLFEQSGVRF